jgi:hypothetical protein
VRAVLAELPSFDGQKVVYGAGCLLGRDRLQAHVGVVKVLAAVGEELSWGYYLIAYHAACPEARA